MPNSAADPVVVLSEGGDLQPEPHAWVVRIYEDGLVQTRAGTRMAGPQAVGALLARLEDTGLFRIDTQSLVQALKESGGQRTIIEGGHGRVTLTVTRRGCSHSVSMSHPEAHGNRDALCVRGFRRAVDLVRAFAAAKPQ